MSCGRVFLGADAVTAKTASAKRPRPNPAKSSWPGRGRDVYVLADSSKLGLRPFHALARLSWPWTLATDDGAYSGEGSGCLGHAIGSQALEERIQGQRNYAKNGIKAVQAVPPSSC